MRNQYSRAGLLCLLVLVLLFAASCKQAAPSVCMLNDFESVQELYSIRPAIKRMSGNIDIVTQENGPVKSGKSSMKFTLEKGIWPDLILYIGEAGCPDVSIAQMSRMQLSVYNGNDAPVTGYVALVAEENTILLKQEFTLAPKQWNDVTLSLAEHSGTFDPAQAVGFSFHAEAGENGVFYFDAWTAAMTEAG